MRILYDGEVYRLQKVGGVSRYFAHLIGRLPRRFAPKLLLGEGDTRSLPAHPNLKVYKYGGHGEFRDRLLSYVLSRRRFDVFHPTYYSLLTGRDPGSYRSPVVLTVWDMIHEIFSSSMDPLGEHAALKRQAIHAADALVCISENTRADLLGRYPALADRVHVTHLAASLDASMSHGPEPVPRRPYFLHVGVRAGYKNFDLLLAAFARVAPARPDAALCVVGAPLADGERRRIAELGLDDRVELFQHPTDAHLAKLYRSSVALVYPSLYEGFGIPPLEAMACGAPVVASNSSSLPEVVGDAGLLFDPRSADELSEILLALLDGPAERERLIERGLRRARQFSWDETVRQTLDIYRSVAARGGAGSRRTLGKT